MNECPYSDTHPQCINGNSCVCGYKVELARTPCWKSNFETGETFPIKGITFEVAAISKRGLVLRKVSA